jgi:hypothetical protein
MCYRIANEEADNNEGASGHVLSNSEVRVVLSIPAELEVRARIMLLYLYLSRLFGIFR